MMSRTNKANFMESQRACGLLLYTSPNATLLGYVWQQLACGPQGEGRLHLGANQFQQLGPRPVALRNLVGILSTRSTAVPQRFRGTATIL